MDDQSNRRDQWDDAYTSRNPSEVSWFQARPQVSLDLIEQTGAAPDAPIIDIGGGASTLVDHLLESGRMSVSVLDVSEASLAHARARLSERGNGVNWIVADITMWSSPEHGYEIWHDRAVLHFLTNPSDQAAYAHALNAALRVRGWAIIGGFAKGGPTRCSGQEIVQHDAASLKGLLGADFELQETRSEVHRTPTGSEQLFAYHVFRRVA